MNRMFNFVNQRSRKEDTSHMALLGPMGPIVIFSDHDTAFSCYPLSRLCKRLLMGHSFCPLLNTCNASKVRVLVTSLRPCTEAMSVSILNMSSQIWLVDGIGVKQKVGQ
jgi:hypothetical protein